MTRCPACDSTVGDRSVCPACGARNERDQTQPRGDRQPSHHQRPAGQQPLPSGIKLLCGLLVLSGIGSLFVGLQLQSIGQTASAYGASAAGNSIGTTALVMLAFGVGELVAAVGLWTRKSWGWTAGMAVSGAGVLASVLLLTNSFTNGVGLMGLVLNAGLGWYIYNQRWVFRDHPGGQQQRTQPQQRHQQSQ